MLRSRCVRVSAIALCPFCGTQTNGGDLDHTPQNAASDQGLNFLLTEYSKKINMNEKLNPTPLNLEMGSYY